MTVPLTPRPSPPILSPGVTGYAVDYPLPGSGAPSNLPQAVDLPRELARAAQQRKIEFWAGRECAREALRALGFQGEAALSIGEGRRPVWPEGYLGSITHGLGFAWTAVAPRSLLRGLGIDSEPVLAGRVFEEIREQVANPGELEALGQTGMSPEAAVTAIFCAKECLFKCLYPVCERFFDFPDALVTRLALGDQALGSGRGSFEIQLETELGEELPRGFHLEGAFLLENGRLHSALEWHVAGKVEN